MTQEQCNHIIGYRHGMNDARLVEADDNLEPDKLFAFCPRCGDEL